mgnify:CR=1 FL=1
MRLIIALLLSTGLQVCALAQSDSTNVAFVSYWSVGDAWHFKITKIKEQWKEGALTKKDSSQYIARLEVIDSTEKAYKIKWSFENTVLSSFKPSSQLSERLSKYKMPQIIYTTSELGEFTGVENWEEIGKMMNEMMDDMIEVKRKESNESAEKFKKAIQPLIAVYLRYIHFPFGIQCKIKEVILYEEQIPNMFGGEAIRGDAKLFLESADTLQKRSILVNQMKINADDAKALVLQVLKKMGLPDQQLSEEMKTARLDIFDNNHFEYFYYPGIPVKIETERISVIKMDAKETRSIDKTIIELTE